MVHLCFSGKGELQRECVWRVLSKWQLAVISTCWQTRAALPWEKSGSDHAGWCWARAATETAAGWGAGQDCHHDSHVSLATSHKTRVVYSRPPSHSSPLLTLKKLWHRPTRGREARLVQLCWFDSVNTENHLGLQQKWWDGARPASKDGPHKHNSQSATVYELKYVPQKLLKCHLNTCHFPVYLKRYLWCEKKKNCSLLNI